MICKIIHPIILGILIGHLGMTEMCKEQSIFTIILMVMVWLNSIGIGSALCMGNNGKAHST